MLRSMLKQSHWTKLKHLNKTTRTIARDYAPTRVNSITLSLGPFYSKKHIPFFQGVLYGQSIISIIFSRFNTQKNSCVKQNFTHGSVYMLLLCIYYCVAIQICYSNYIFTLWLRFDRRLKDESVISRIPSTNSGIILLIFRVVHVFVRIIHNDIYG